MKVPVDRVLCPTDASATGNLAVPLAYHLAANGGTVYLLHVCEPPRFGNPLYEQYVHGYVPTEEEQQAGLERVKRELHKLPPKSALERGVQTEYLLVEGINVGNVIESEARRLDVDVVVLGTHGRTGLSRLLMGSVATDVVNKQDLPVILVHQDGLTG